RGPAIRRRLAVGRAVGGREGAPATASAATELARRGGRTVGRGRVGGRRRCPVGGHGGSGRDRPRGESAPPPPRPPDRRPRSLAATVAPAAARGCVHGVQ